LSFLLCFHLLIPKLHPAYCRCHRTLPDACCAVLMLQAWLAEYQDGTACHAASSFGSGSGDIADPVGHAFGRAGQLQQALVLLGGGAGGTAGSGSAAAGRGGWLQHMAGIEAPM
jgi:hypothetical protein